MSPPPEGASGRGRRRSHHACFACRRKKTRCPGEKPACSTCTRMKQPCSYPPVNKPSRSGRSEERLAHLEEKLDLLLSGGLTNQASSRQEPSLDEIANTSEKSFSETPPAVESNQAAVSSSNSISHVLFDAENSNLRPRPSDIADGINLYFKYCHRQPIWCFERDEVSEYGMLPEELSFSILALTSRFSDKRDQLQVYSDSAKTLVMLHIANGMVELTTIESLCLLSYSSFIDGDFHLGQFHLGLAFQLCRSAMLDLVTSYAIADRTSERKKRLFWSLQLLEQYYGRQNGLLSVPTETWRPSYSSSADLDPMGIHSKAPPLPRDVLGCTRLNEPGIWNTSIHLAWVWSQVRKYVTNCSQNILREPWKHDSMYSKVLSDFMETENMIPICHRYDTAKFYKRKIEELRVNRDYWAPWLKEQFTYHAIPTVLNHPFLYIVGAQYNPNLAIPNTFWRRSSELALLHSTWIVRMIDMVMDKQVPLADPFFGHVAAIAATVHLYYCCAAAPRLKHKSNTDFAKCRRFLKSFASFSSACEALDRNLEKMTRMAAGPDIMDMEDWMPSKIYLSVPLMWEVLQFNSVEESHGNSTLGLLDASLTPTSMARDDENTTLEIIVATSPEITVNTADGGQEAPTSVSYNKTPGGSSRESTWSTPRGDNRSETRGDARSAASAAAAASDKAVIEQADSLTYNTTPWLYADSSRIDNMGDIIFEDSQPGISETRGMAWWEGENFGNVMFNSF